MKYLGDSNYFIALAVEGHKHHKIALNWLTNMPAGCQILFCRPTQQTFLRLLTVSSWMRDQVCANSSAIKIYEGLMSDPRIGFNSSEPAGIEPLWLLYAGSKQASPNLWMDAYLAAFARCARLPWVTFDQAFRQFEGLELFLLDQ